MTNFLVKDEYKRRIVAPFPWTKLMRAAWAGLRTSELYASAFFQSTFDFCGLIRPPRRVVEPTLTRHVDGAFLQFGTLRFAIAIRAGISIIYFCLAGMQRSLILCPPLLHTTVIHVSFFANYLSGRSRRIRSDITTVATR
jgi:hypothetical protein